MTGYHRSTQINEQELLKLKMIVDENPNYCLHEIALVFEIDTGKFLQPTTIWRYMTEWLEYNQQVLTTLAKQQCEGGDSRFKVAFALLLQGYLERLVTVDETHKDQNSAR